MEELKQTKENKDNVNRRNRRSQVQIRLNLFCTVRNKEYANKSLTTWQINKEKTQEIEIVAKGLKDKSC